MSLARLSFLRLVLIVHLVVSSGLKLCGLRFLTLGGATVVRTNSWTRVCVEKTKSRASGSSRRSNITTEKEKKKIFKNSYKDNENCTLKNCPFTTRQHSMNPFNFLILLMSGLYSTTSTQSGALAHFEKGASISRGGYL